MGEDTFGKEKKMSEERKKILIIDDDPDFVLSTKMMLEVGGYEVVAANSGKEGVEKAHAEKPDLILVDIMMETWGEGFNVINKVRGDDSTKNIPMLMISSMDIRGRETPYAGDEWFPSDNILVKPIEEKALFSRIERLLGSVK